MLYQLSYLSRQGYRGTAAPEGESEVTTSITVVAGGGDAFKRTSGAKDRRTYCLLVFRRMREQRWLDFVVAALSAVVRRAGDPAGQRGTAGGRNGPVREISVVAR